MKKCSLILFLALVIMAIPLIVYSNDTQVYVDSNDIDRDYHRLNCQFIPKNYKSISVEEAFNQGFRRCPICEPIISDAEKKLKDEEYKERKERADEIINSVNSGMNTTSTYASNSDNRTVYVTTNGSKFHIPGCDDLNNTPRALTVSAAQNKGYAPCKVCNPYGLADEMYGKQITDDYYLKAKDILFYIILAVLSILIVYIIINEKNYKKTHYKVPTTEIKHNKN